MYQNAPLNFLAEEHLISQHFVNCGFCCPGVHSVTCATALLSVTISACLSVTLVYCVNTSKCCQTFSGFIVAVLLYFIRIRLVFVRLSCARFCCLFLLIAYQYHSQAVGWQVCFKLTSCELGRCLEVEKGIFVLFDSELFVVITRLSSLLYWCSITYMC